MSYTSDQEIIREEIESIVADIKELYNNSGKRASGQFEKELEVVYSPNKAVIRGVVYLAGRKAGKMPPVQRIIEWVKLRGIKAIEKNVSQKSLAWAIAKKIAKSGTNRENALNIYEKVITPQRINRIIDRVAELNVNRLITEIRAELEILARGV
jgi:hypothetical protein